MYTDFVNQSKTIDEDPKAVYFLFLAINGHQKRNVKSSAGFERPQLHFTFHKLSLQALLCLPLNPPGAGSLSQLFYLFNTGQVKITWDGLL